MPRSSDSEKTPRKRAQRKRVSSERVSSSRERAPRAPRKRVVEKRSVSATKKPSPQTRSVERPASTSTRKAPTPLASKKAKSSVFKKQAAIIGLVFVIGVLGSAAVGITDSGQIDVNKEIEARNDRVRSGQMQGESSAILVPVQNTEANRLVDGGLIPSQVDISNVAPTPVEEPASTTASSTTDTASTTEATASSTDESTTEEDAEEVVEDEDNENEDNELEVVETSGR